jgi:tRNA threonylcarbamoyl adenosine modification protein (Sua5/YciO/YrdC/YwlC family)
MRTLSFRRESEVAAAAAAAVETTATHGVILLPTETFYGLAADPTDPDAVDRVFAAKGRPRELALPVLCCDWQQLGLLVHVPERFRVRLSRVWPAALTAILPALDRLPAAPAGTVAVRLPGHAMLRSVLYRTGPLTGTSANRHGRPACVEPEAALAALATAPDLVLDGGRTAGGAASTLVDLTGDEPRILRQGAVIWDEFYPTE